MDAKASARKFVDTWLRAWPASDAEAIGAMYADDAVFVSHPFRRPEDPRDYARRAFEEESFVEARFGEPVACDDRATVEYWAVLKDADGKEQTLIGLALLRFADDGRIAAHRDYWAMEGGRHEPASGWGH
jgi:SnoaL-like domain